MGWWKADPLAAASDSSTKSANPNNVTPQAIPPVQESSQSCPVDPKTREIWLQKAKSQSQSQSNPSSSSLPPSHPPLQLQGSKSQKSTSILPSSQECSSDRIDQTPISQSNSMRTNTSTPAPTSRPLSHERTVSSIPRASLPETFQSPNKTTPANSETETGPHTSGNWIYPSESQFFQAVMRKRTASNPADLVSSISHIIPIHNAVNERAWSLIKGWEGSSSASCGGPKLLSFRGLGAGAISPKARMKSLWGYTEPFDRHDWVVERCGGETVEYVIDFYQGKQEQNNNQRNGNLSFYLDVRPKLNSFQGCKMRLERLVGFR